MSTKHTATTEASAVKQEPRIASIKTLHSDPDNPRQISTRALQGLDASTTKFGDLSGIVFNKRSGVLVAGTSG